MYTLLRRLVLKSGNANDKFTNRTRAIYNITKKHMNNYIAEMDKSMKHERTMCVTINNNKAHVHTVYDEQQQCLNSLGDSGKT